jgi:putative peptide zinc metalloprotease protein
MPLMRAFLSPFGMLLWLALVGFATFAIAPEWQRLISDAKHTISPSNWMWLWAVFVVTKLIHELGHAFMCRRFGGEVHELGIMFLVFIPTPYVDASTAWGFPNKWHRILVGAGGMIFEIFFAAICALIWLNTDPTSLLSQLCYNAMFIASVSTVIFNANPLLRYDGYYMLSDYLEIPNLQKKSSEYTLGLIKRHVFRIKPQQPLPPPLQRFWLFNYAIFSTAYRTFVMFAIIFMVTYQLPEEVRWAGLLMALGGVITWACVPIFKLFKYLTIEPELHRKRGRAWAFTLACTAGLVVLFGMIPFNVDVHAEGVVDPREERMVFADSPGFVAEVAVTDGQVVSAGDVLLVLTDDQIEARVKELESMVRASEAQVRQLMATDPAQAQIQRQELELYRGQLADAHKRRERLTVRAPIAGQFIAPQYRELAGRYVGPGQQVALIRQLDEVVIKASVTQGEVELVKKHPEGDARVRLVGRFGDVLHATGYRLVEGAQKEIDPALTHTGGGSIAPDPRDPSGRTPMQQPFSLRVELSNPRGEFVPGQRAYVKLRLDQKPLLWQGWRRLLQLIQASSST